MKGTIVDRIHAKVVHDPATDCWNWTGAYSTNKRGADRPVISVGGRIIHTMRVTLSFIHGLDPALVRGGHAGHTCDNPKCVNPHHGEWVSASRNMSDRHARHPRIRVSK